MTDYSERRSIPWRLIAWSMAGLLLLVPLVAMRFTSEVNWEVDDFAFAGIMIVGTGLLFEAAVRMSSNRAYRFGAALALVISFLLIWVNLAVGIIGSEDDPLNLMYGGVLGVALIGAVIARFRANGMTRAMIAAAVAQVAVAIVAQFEGHFTWVITAALGGMWLLSAGLFRKAAEAR
jgi:hypothetical protein